MEQEEYFLNEYCRQCVDPCMSCQAVAHNVNNLTEKVKQLEGWYKDSLLLVQKQFHEKEELTAEVEKLKENLDDCLILLKVFLSSEQYKKLEHSFENRAISKRIDTVIAKAIKEGGQG